MNQETISAWISYLTNPFVLAGFILFVLAGLSWLFKGMIFDKLSRGATGRLLKKLVMGCLILGIVSMIWGFVSTMQKQSRSVPTLQTSEEVQNNTVSPAGCEALAAVDSEARVSGGGGELQTVSQTVKDVVGGLSQGGCNAATSGQKNAE